MDDITFGQMEVVAESDKAICVAFREREVWLPKSRVALSQDHDGDFVEGHDWVPGTGSGYVRVTMPRWLGAKHRMLY